MARSCLPVSEMLPTMVLETPRLQLRQALRSDSPFFLRLLNEPSWLEHIGDLGVRSLAQAQSYIRGIRARYRALGYGMYVIQLKSTGHPIGICGLVKRDFLPGPDLGFALLPEHMGYGYAAEASRALMSHATGKLGIARLYAIARPGNHRSVRLLERLGFQLQGPYLVPQGREMRLYTST